VSDSESSQDKKNGKLQSASRKWKNLCDALAEDALKDNAPKISDEEIKRVREKLTDAAAESHVAKMEKRLAKEQHRKTSKYIN
jgi:hypothetical protein